MIMNDACNQPIQARRCLAQAIRARRAHLGWSQEKLAEVSGLHRTYISSVERSERNVSIDNIWRIAQALGVRISDLFVAEEL
jgi:transcriptional regulator with XRE-family HTH domain